MDKLERLKSKLKIRKEKKMLVLLYWGERKIFQVDSEFYKSLLSMSGSSYRKKNSYNQNSSTYTI